MKMVSKNLQVVALAASVVMVAPSPVSAQSFTDRVATFFGQEQEVPPITDIEWQTLSQNIADHQPGALLRYAQACSVGAGVARNLQTAMTYSIAAAALADREGNTDIATSARKLTARIEGDVDAGTRAAAEAAAEHLVRDRDTSRRAAADAAERGRWIDDRVRRVKDFFGVK